MRVDAAGVALIKRFEGLGGDPPGTPYQDAVGVWTIGYGHTAGVTKDGWDGHPRLTEQQASHLLQHDLDTTYVPPIAALRLPLNQNQVNATASFVYNLGPGVLSPYSTFGAALRRRDWKAAADAMLLYDTAAGRVLPGLKTRRQAERALFLKPAAPSKVIPPFLRWVAWRLGEGPFKGPGPRSSRARPRNWTAGVPAGYFKRLAVFLSRRRG